MTLEKPLVSAVIVSHNEIDHISKGLDALLHQSYKPCEILVYDNHSTDGTPEFVCKNYSQVKLIPGKENLGFGGANNLAAQQACGKYIAFLNCDAVVEPRWLEPIIELMENDSSIGCVGAEIVCSENPEILFSCGTASHLSGITYTRGRGKPALPGEPIEVGSVNGGACVINKEFFLGIGGFESVFFLYYEDTDLSFRVRLHHKRCMVVPEARIRHSCCSKFGKQKVFYLERNRYLSLFSLMDPGTLLIMAPSIILFEMFSWGFCLISGKETLIMKIKAWKEIYQRQEWILERRRKHSTLKVDRSYLLQIFSPHVELEYVHSSKIFPKVAAIMGYIVASPVFLGLRFIKGIKHL
jgi:N-acetylglucosaminyl-diphospho-decaprenol L-rhamnosyltransferase